MNTGLAILALGAAVVLSLLTWILSIFKRDVSVVDSAWSLMILACGTVYFYVAESAGTTGVLVFILLVLWAVRLSLYLTWRNWGAPEDRRYRELRSKYSPGFTLKSLFIVFLLQALLAWFISIPLWPALTVSAPFGALALIALLVWLTGMIFEVVGDWQLARFKATENNGEKVLDTGLWRYTRHPNYFGEALIWWSFYLFALDAGGWWTLPAPLLMSWLLLRFSGVVLLEKTISGRRPDYRRYIETTNAFIPGPRRLLADK